MRLAVLAVLLLVSACQDSGSHATAADLPSRTAKDTKTAQITAADPTAPAPEPTYIFDAAGVLSPSFERELSARLKGIDDASSVQIAVVAVDTLDGASPRAYALRLGREMRVGQSGLNNGVVVLLAPREAEVFVSVGTGLEWQIPDAEAQRVVATMVGSFRTGDYPAGLRAGVEQLAALATAVSWDVRYPSLQDLPENRARAVSAVLVIEGTPTGDGSTIDVDGEQVRLLFSPYWDRGQFSGGPTTVTGRIVTAVPLTLQVLDAAEG